MNRDAMMVPLTYLIQFAGPIDSKTAEAIASALLDAGLHLEQCGIDYTHCTSKGDETLAPDMSKLNSEQIIKTLEWCIQAPDCENCEYKYEHKHQIDVCSIRSDALALIKELTEKVENYRNELGEVRVALAEANNDKKKLTEENERLRAEVADLKDELKCEKETNAHLCSQYMSENHLRHQAEEMLANGMSVVYSDTVRKMQKRINAHFDSDSDYFRSSHGYIRSVVDQIAKEMLEEK